MQAPSSQPRDPPRVAALIPPIFSPGRARKVKTFKDIGSLHPNDNEFYVPQAHNNPLFDALCFCVQDKSIVIWIFQVTIKKIHTGVSSGFDLLSTLVTATRSRCPDHNVQVRYLLLVPKHQQWTVRWSMAPGFIRGKVFIQFIDCATYTTCPAEEVIHSDGRAEIEV